MITNLVLLILMLSGCLLATTLVMASKAARQVSDSVIQQTFRNMQDRMGQFFTPLRNMLLIQTEWINDNAVDPMDMQQMNRLLMPILKNVRQASSINISDMSGRSYMLLREGDGWRTRLTNPDEWGNRNHWYWWKDPITPIQDEWIEQDYLATSRVWFKGAIDQYDPNMPADSPVQVFWSDPYTFYTTGDLGITCSLYVDRPNGESLVVALDVLLSDLTNFTQHTDVSPNGKVLMVTADGLLVALPRHPQFAKADARRNALLKTPEELDIPVLAEASEAFREVEYKLNKLIQFESNGKEWWGGAQPYHLSTSKTFYIAVTVPAADFFGPVQSQLQSLAIVITVAIIFSLSMALWLARRYSDPINQLAVQSDDLRQLHLSTPANIESPLVEVRRLAESQERMRSALDSFARYVPMDVVHQLLDQGTAAQIGGETRELTILFTDIVGFTSIAESMSAEQVTSHVSDYFEQMTDTIRRHGGTVDKFVGDAVVAFWGAPKLMENHTVKAVEAVLACQTRLDSLNDQWVKDGKPALPTRFGLSCGQVVVGNFGAPTRLAYTAVGDAVNLASRLEELNRFYGTTCLVSEAVRKGGPSDIVWRRIDRVAVRGRTHAGDIYEPVGREDKIDQQTRLMISEYELALEKYQAGDFEAAQRIAGTLAGQFPQDQAIAAFRQRCLNYLADPPGSDWDGVTRLEMK